MIRKTLWWKLFITCIILLLSGLGMIFGAAYLLGPPSIAIEEKTVFYNAHGERMPYHLNEANITPLNDISPYFLQAIVLVEDKHFYEHHGFQINRIIKAIITNIRSSTLKEGASTITQQLAKNLYLSNEKTWERKLKEAFYTIRLEMFYSKEEILQSYIHSIYFGHGAYGIHEASSYFFDKDPNDLSLSEAATLAAIPKGPTYYSPLNNPKKSQARKEHILQLLEEEEVISATEAKVAAEETPTYDIDKKHADTNTNYYIDTVLREAAALLKLEKEAILNGNYMIYTTYDTKLQASTEKAIADHIPEDSDLQVATVMMDVSTGAIRSLAGGKSYQESTFNRAIDAKRMVGSTFKPIVYYTALEQGFTPVTKLVSEPTVFDLPNGKTYRPRNYHDYYAYGAITLADAMALSDNIYAVKTNLLVRPEKVVETARKFGIREPLSAVPSLALGISSISVLDMTNAYRIMANKGKSSKGYTIEKITHRNGSLLYERIHSKRKETTTLNEQKLFILTSLMQGMFDTRLNNYMEVTGASIQSMLTKTYAGKSGSTDTDSWMIGYSPSITAGVWVGYDNNKTIQLQAEKMAAKMIWAQIMEAAHEGDKNETFPVPSQVETKLIDPTTGQLATPFCPIRRKTYFEANQIPTTFCKVHTNQNEALDEEIDHETKRHDFFTKLRDFFTFYIFFR